ncbi:MCE family protein [Mycolicibacterium sp. A43C]
MLDRRIKIQLAIFSVVAVVAGSIMLVGYIRVPQMMGVGRYTVSVELPRSGGLYPSGNVTYRGIDVGRVVDVRLTDTAVQAQLSLRSDVPIPGDATAEIHSTSAIGEQYVALLPRSGSAAPLRNGDVIPIGRTSVPPDINSLLNAASRGLQAIPGDDVKTVVDQSALAVGGLGPELARIVRGSTQLAIDAEANLDPLVTLIEKSSPLLDSQRDTSDAIDAWASHAADLATQVAQHDGDVAGVLEHGPAAAEQARQAVQRLQPTLPTLLASMVSIDRVAITYQPAIEQLLVLLPFNVAILQAAALPNRDTGKMPGLFLNFNINVNLPPPCTTGYLPVQQHNSFALEQTPERPAGDFYCRIPQDHPIVGVRGARNYPCLDRPGKRAPTVAMCESDEEYIPLNDGYNWKGDPNATITGQSVPQLPPVAATIAERPNPPSATAVPTPEGSPPPAPISATFYDPATGSYLGPDGQVRVREDLTTNREAKTWQSMLIPPTSK